MAGVAGLRRGGARHRLRAGGLHPPLAGFVRAPLEAVRRAAELGAWIELCWTNIAPGRMDPVAAVHWLREVGLDHVVVSSDYFRAATPNPPELFRFLLGTLHEAGLQPEEIRRVAVVNPARALGLAPLEG